MRRAIRKAPVLLTTGLLLAFPISATAKRAPAKKPKLLAHAAPSTPPSLELVKIDLPASAVQVLVGGTYRAPDPRLFTFTDERRRRFVPSIVECHPAEGVPEGEQARPAPRESKEGRWACSLGIARIYQRAALIGISVQVRSQTVAIAGDQVQSAWAEARSTTPLPISERPRAPGAPWGPVRPAPDGGPTRDNDAIDSEEE